MILAMCLDDRNGILFNGRRQSSDCAVTAKLMELAGNQKIWLNDYSAKIFPPKRVFADSDFLEKAGKGQICFVENEDPTAFLKQVEAILVFRWNKVYPSDKKFSLEHWTLESKADFPGNSHERITQEVYIR